MSKKLACLVTGLFVAGSAGIVQSAAYNAREDCSTEGPPYIRDARQEPVVPTRVVEKGSLYIEGMGFAPSAKGRETVVPKASGRCDYGAEGFSDEELENMYNMRKMNRRKTPSGI